MLLVFRSIAVQFSEHTKGDQTASQELRILELHNSYLTKISDMFDLLRLIYEPRTIQLNFDLDQVDRSHDKAKSSQGQIDPQVINYTIP